MTKHTNGTTASKNTELRILSDADLNAVAGGAKNEDSPAFRAFVRGAAIGYGGEVCIGSVCSGGGGTVTF